MSTDALTAFLATEFPKTEAALSALTSTTDDPRVTHNLHITRFYSSRSQSALTNLIYFISSHIPSGPLTKAEFFTKIVDEPAILKTLHSKLGPVALFNAAVIAYAEGFLSAASALVRHLYPNIEAMDDALALHLCFLMADVHLRMNDTRQALQATSYAERLISQWGKKESDETMEQLPRMAPQWLGRTISLLEPPITFEDAKFSLHIYNARISAAEDGSKNRKEAKSAVLAADDSDTRPTAAALLVKARVEANHSKGLRILGSVGSGCRDGIWKKIKPLALNSLGVLHHRLGRHALAACYFEEARRAFSALFEIDGTGVGGMALMKDASVCYNLGLQYMKLGEFSRALDLFSVCARKDSAMAEGNVLLWIRMAECCIGMDNAERSDPYKLSKEGRGRGSRMVIRMEPLDEGLAMEYASTCARGALAILDQRKKKDDLVSSAPKRGIAEKAKMEKIASLKDYEVLLRGAALCIMAYSCLSFDPHATLDACEKLQKLYPQSDNERALLGRLYAAEALCQLGRPADAANRLAPLLAINENNESNLREAACINMALSHMSGGDVHAASRAAKVALKVANNTERPNSLRRQAGFVAAYIFLQSDETETAKRVLRVLRTF